MSLYDIVAKTVLFLIIADKTVFYVIVVVLALPKARILAFTIVLYLKCSLKFRFSIN